MKDEAAKKRYLDSVNASRVKRMQWWHEARGWGIHLNFSVPEKQRTGSGGVFPEGMTIA
jgi:hypothetical protein